MGTPSDFAAELSTKSFTSKFADEALVNGIYKKAFEDNFAKARNLEYIGLGWNDDDAIRFASVLSSDVVFAVLRIDLTSNAISDRGMNAIVDALEGARRRDCLPH